MYCIDYSITVVLIFPPLAPSTEHPHSLHQSPHHCSCPWVMRKSSLAIPFPILYFTSLWPFCNYLFVLLHPPTSHPFSNTHPPISLSLTFGILIMMCLGVGLFVSILFGSRCFLDLHVYFLHQIRQVLLHYYFK